MAAAGCGPGLDQSWLIGILLEYRTNVVGKHQHLTYLRIIRKILNNKEGNEVNIKVVKAGIYSHVPLLCVVELL